MTATTRPLRDAALNKAPVNAAAVRYECSVMCTRAMYWCAEFGVRWRVLWLDGRRLSNHPFGVQHVLTRCVFGLKSAVPHITCRCVGVVRCAASILLCCMRAVLIHSVVRRMCWCSSASNGAASTRTVSSTSCLNCLVSFSLNTRRLFVRQHFACSAIAPLRCR